MSQGTYVCVVGGMPVFHSSAKVPASALGDVRAFAYSHCVDQVEKNLGYATFSSVIDSAHTTEVHTYMGGAQLGLYCEIGLSVCRSVGLSAHAVCPCSSF